VSAGLGNNVSAHSQAASLAIPMAIDRDGEDSVRVLDGGTLIAEGTCPPGSLAIELPDRSRSRKLALLLPDTVCGPPTRTSLSDLLRVRARSRPGTGCTSRSDRARARTCGDDPTEPADFRVVPAPAAIGIIARGSAPAEPLTVAISKATAAAAIGPGNRATVRLPGPVLRPASSDPGRPGARTATGPPRSRRNRSSASR